LAAGKNLRGAGSETTGGTGLGLMGSGSGGGGSSATTMGLSNKGTGDGLTGKGMGRYGSGGDLRGSGVGRPAIEIGSASETIIVGGLDKSVIDEYIKRHMRQISGCYSRELTSKPGLKGRVATRFVITGSGRVSQASVTSSKLNDPITEKCVLGVIKLIVFPEPLGGGVVEVDYPFDFTPAIGG